MLSPEQIASREGKLTASRVACLMTGDNEKILNLWRELIGDPAFIPDDLSDVWPVQLGSVTETLNLDWYAKKKAPVTRRGEVVLHQSNPYFACTLDGWDEALPGPVEAKHVGGREPLAKVIERYMPQLHWQMIVANARKCALTVIEGANEPIVEIIEFDEAYGNELLRRAEAFIDCVRTLTPPVAIAPIAAPVKAEKTYDMREDNEFCDDAVTWLENYEAGKKASAAEKRLKAKVPVDAKRCHAAGIEITRDRAGRLSLKVSKE